jgi:hypothetical protein
MWVALLITRSSQQIANRTLPDWRNWQTGHTGERTCSEAQSIKSANSEVGQDIAKTEGRSSHGKAGFFQVHRYGRRTLYTKERLLKLVRGQEQSSWAAQGGLNYRALCQTPVGGIVSLLCSPAVAVSVSTLD